jgi:hypothetical protein
LLGGPCFGVLGLAALINAVVPHRAVGCNAGI